MIVRRIGVVSVAKLSAALYGAIGLIVGFFISLISLFGMAAALGGDHATGAMGALFGVGSIILLPLFYGVFGFVVGAISALIYNIVARFVGGIEIEVE
jgi:hypothetical protein